MLVFGLSTLFWLSLLALAVTGAADMVSVVIRQTLVQLETPDEMRGRVSAVNSIFIGASQPARRVRVGRHRGAGSGRSARWWSAASARCWSLRLWMRLFPALWRRESLAAPGPT